MIQTFSCQLCENRRQDTISMATETMLERDVRKEEVVVIYTITLYSDSCRIGSNIYINYCVGKMPRFNE